VVCVYLPSALAPPPGSTGGWVQSPALGADGTVYAASNAGTVLALNASTGALRWAFSRPGQSVYSSPALSSNGGVYVGMENSMIALDATSGALLWNVTTRTTVVGSASLGPDGSLVFGSGDNMVRAVRSP
jgi:outer membrane protein assembly factor BamB